jgi:chemotaxis protein MotA
MLLIGGAVVVILSVAGGYLWHGGHLLLLWQPAEFLIIGGSAVGIMLTSTPVSVVKLLVEQLKQQFTPPPGESDYEDLLVMMYQLFRTAQANGAMGLESHLDNPAESTIFSKYPKFLKRHGSLAFLVDSVRVVIAGGVSTHDFEHLMYEDLEVRHREELAPSSTLLKVADALPGLGIVAAVLGVVITMQAIGGSPAEIGHKVGAALVGTFLGILLSYGFVQPVAVSVEHRVTVELNIEQTIKAGLLAMHKGFAPAIAVEFARRVIPEDVRPSFEETEKMCKEARSTPVRAAA